MRRLSFGLLFLVAMASANVLKYEKKVFPGQDVHFSNHHVKARSIHAEPVDFDVIKQRFHALNHNIVKRSPGWKSKGSSKSKGSGSGFFSSKAKGGNNNNKGQDHYNSGHSNYNGNKHASAPQQPAYNPSYGQPAHNYGHAAPSYGQPAYHPQPGYNPGPGYHAPAPGYGQPAYHAPAPGYGQPAYHAPAPRPSVVVVHSGGAGGGGGYAPAMKGPGIGTAIATGLAQGAGSGVGFGVANAAINSLTGGGNRHHDDRPYQAPPQNNNNNNNNNPSSNNNNNQNSENYNSQANPECLKSCYSTEEYAPVCGTDGWEYANIGKLNCMKTCGKRVEVARYGNCNIPPPPGYGTAPVGGNALPPQPQPNAVPPPANAQSLPPNAVPPPPPNTPVDSPAGPPLDNSKGLPPGIEGPEGPKGLITGAPIDSPTTNVPSTTVSAEYTTCVRNCETTSEYSPQCGTDGQNYSNPSKVKCARGCGKVVDIAHEGICETTTAPSRTTPTTESLPQLASK